MQAIWDTKYFDVLQKNNLEIDIKKHIIEPIWIDNDFQVTIHIKILIKIKNW